MVHKTVGDVMTRDVIAVGADTPFREIVRTLAVYRFSGVPVVDRQRRVIGMVTEADLLGRQARAGGAVGSATWHLLRHRAFSRRGTTLTAADLMSTPVETTAPDARLSAAAVMLARYGVKRVPVVDPDGVLVGVISRRDVLSVYLRPDADLAAEIQSEVLQKMMSLAPSQMSVEVDNGIVTLCGKVKRQSQIDIITSLVSAVDGVIDVRGDIAAEIDDTER